MIPLNLDIETELTSVKCGLSASSSELLCNDVLRSYSRALPLTFCYVMCNAMDDSKSEGKNLNYFSVEEKGLKLKFRKTDNCKELCL